MHSTLTAYDQSDGTAVNISSTQTAKNVLYLHCFENDGMELSKR